jgi:hypothetical protein
MRIIRPAAVLAFATALVSAACADTSGTDSPIDQQPRTSARGDTVDAPYGAAEPRINVIDALAGRRSAITLRMQRFTVEGVSIVWVLSATRGEAVLRIDERLDGGGIRSYTLSDLRLVEYVPSRWVNNVEVEKEKMVPVDAATARARSGVYLLVAPHCLTAPCAEVF